MHSTHTHTQSTAQHQSNKHTTEVMGEPNGNMKGLNFGYFHFAPFHIMDSDCVLPLCVSCYFSLSASQRSVCVGVSASQRSVCVGVYVQSQGSEPVGVGVWRREADPRQQACGCGCVEEGGRPKAASLWVRVCGGGRQTQGSEPVGVGVWRREADPRQ